MGEQQNLVEDGLEPETLRLFEADFTPLPLIDQLFGWVTECLDVRPLGILDPSAGAGAFLQVARDHFPEATRVAVEPRRSELPHLRRHAHLALTTKLEDFAAEADGAYDLIPGNPPFSFFAEFVRTGLDLLTEGGLLALLGPVDWWQRGAEKLDLFRENEEHLFKELRIPGTVNFRGGTGTSSWQSYSWWLYSREVVEPHGWHTQALPLLPGSLRRWRERPGTGRWPL